MGSLFSREQQDAGSPVDGKAHSTLVAADTPLQAHSNCKGSTSKEHAAVTAWHRGTLGVGLSGAGFLMPYHIGALEALVQHGVVDRSTPMAGASAGSLVVCSYKCGLSFDTQMQKFLEVAHSCRKEGVHGRLRALLKAQLIECLPPNAAELVNGTMHIAVSRPVPRPRNKMFCNFHDATDLRKALLASCHLPLLSDGWMFTRFRGKRAFDGGLTNAVPVVPGAEYTVRISALPGHNPSNYPAMLRFPKTEELAAAPGIFTPWPFTVQQTNRVAFFPGDDAFMHGMRRQGREDMTKWLESVGLLSALAAGRDKQAPKAGISAGSPDAVVLAAAGSSSSGSAEDSSATGAHVDPATELQAAGVEAGLDAPLLEGRTFHRCDTHQAAEQLREERDSGLREPQVGVQEAAVLAAETAAVAQAGRQYMQRLSEHADNA